MDTETVEFMGNRVQVTVRDMVKVFQLEKKNSTDNNRDRENFKIKANIIGEIIATESLLDPQKFVET